MAFNPEHVQRQLDTATQLKDQANQLFKEQKYKEAYRLYWQGYMHVKGLEGVSAFRSLSESRDCSTAQTRAQDAFGKELVLTLRLNSVMCLLKLEMWEKAAEKAKEVLKDHPTNVKAHYRLGLALLELGDLAGAEDALRSAEHVSPTDKAIKDAQKRLKEKLKVHSKKEENIFKNILA
eukprot:comp9721_c0_seq1/m.4697 comp9721_c0_seq1/g.4697  ORF comp9721_c0_seq1/g.4697 comp9721_c0_seq1/m.4697 type:complete len:178 (-) comp9721_c0_seq1:214-747(-)